MGILGNKTEHSRLNVWPGRDHQEQSLLPSLTHGDPGLRGAGLSEFDLKVRIYVVPSAVLDSEDRAGL